METKRPNFSLGRLFGTPGAIDALHPDDLLAALGRHTKGDWGECCPEEWRANDEGVDEYVRLQSVYHDRRGTKFWIITLADRSATSILLDSEP